MPEVAMIDFQIREIIDAVSICIAIAAVTVLIGLAFIEYKRR